jgi:glycine/D-amino acid oxidase-like deaminating enzyme
LSGEAPAYVFDLVRRYGIECDARLAGSIRVVRTSAETPLIEGSIKAWGERGTPLQFLDRTALHHLIGTDAYASGLLDQRGGSLNPLAYAQGLAKSVTRLGGKIFSHTPVTGLESHGERWLLRTPHGTVEADWVVLATNGYTDGLWPGLRATVVPAFSAIAATAPLPAPLLSKILPGRQVAYESSWRVLYFRIDGHGRLLMGGPSAQRECQGPSAHRHLVAHAERMFPELKGIAWQHFWNGQVAVTTDHYPHLHEPAPGVVAALGYNGRGIAMATAMGRIVSRRILGAAPKELELPVSAFQPFPFHRFWRPIVEAAQMKYTLMDKLQRIA